MKINSKFIVIFNLLIFFLFLLPSGKLDLFEENYSTLSLNARGYFFLLFLGISCGSIMAYETSFISGKRNALLLFAGLLMGTVVPHHVPYDCSCCDDVYEIYDGQYGQRDHHHDDLHGDQSVSLSETVMKGS